MCADQAIFRVPMRSGLEREVDFSVLRYGQCWEDADILLDALGRAPGRVFLSIASAGENTLSLLATQPKRVLAIDLSPAQIAALELRTAAFRTLDHQGMLELLGSRNSTRREALYSNCRLALAPTARRFWDGRRNEIRAGVSGAGRFEKYLSFFRRFVLPLCQSPGRIRELLDPSARPDGDWIASWANARWNLLFSAVSSRLLLSKFGREPRFFRFADDIDAAELARRFERVARSQESRANPYLHWMVRGFHGDALPFALRAENFEVIRDNLDRLELYQTSLGDFLDQQESGSVDGFNLSDVFEYMSPDQYNETLAAVARVGRKGALLAYWNLFAKRRRSSELVDLLRSHDDLSRALHERDKVFFYSDFVVEEVI